MNPWDQIIQKLESEDSTMEITNGRVHVVFEDDATLDIDVGDVSLLNSEQVIALHELVDRMAAEVVRHDDALKGTMLRMEKAQRTTTKTTVQKYLWEIQTILRSR